MSEGSAARVRYVERPVMPGTRLVVWAPAGHDLLGTEPLAAGQGFTMDVSGDDEAGRWRTVLLSWDADADGSGTTLEVEVEGRYE